MVITLALGAIAGLIDGLLRRFWILVTELCFAAAFAVSTYFAVSPHIEGGEVVPLNDPRFVEAVLLACLLTGYAVANLTMRLFSWLVGKALVRPIMGKQSEMSSKS